MGTTYNAGVVSIAGAHTAAHLSVGTAHLCARRADLRVTEFSPTAWQHTGTTALTNTQQLVPLAGRQGTGVSVSSPETSVMAGKRIRTFEGHMGPQLSSGTG